MPINQPNVQIHTANIPSSPSGKMRRLRMKAQLSFQDRLMRNSALACAVLLGILALGNVNAPWATKASEGIRQALTMEIDLDESLGQMQFVQKLMPESALVFFNLNGGSEFSAPVHGTLMHNFDALQPWLMYECDAGSDVLSPADGIISAVSMLSDGSWGVLIDHGNGRESVLAGLKEVHLQSGDHAAKGSGIGKSSETLYFELREMAQAVDPSELLGL